eukprot:CAMPEP_0197027674 /NCGR_PEP_ID=MMETSP1384-20130603/7538_1 /TAXON_ID=29189 /ORGANISM="Ammonia sp." /LENGTH=682 /DNA_ID=CAMNT_0042456553 /DNA_START=111 /DNA_END=2159 /DNA_ORIENTATION=+
MSSPAASNKKKQKQRDLEKTFVKSIRKQLNENKNWDDAVIASQAVLFKDQQYMNCFEALRDSWDDYREESNEDEHEQEKEEASMEEPKPSAILPELTKASSTDEPDTVESLIMDRHVYELLYNILLASHCDMAQRKSKLMNELYRNEQIAKKENRRKKSEIIAKYLPTNDKTMARIINHIFDEIVQKHYKNCPVFVKLEKRRIVQYIKTACNISFQMLFAENELSFFPLLFTDQSTSYIAPVVRYDKIIKKWQKNNGDAKTSLTPKLEPQPRKRLYSHVRASSEFHEGMAFKRSFASFRATQILYYTYPGIIDAKHDKIHQQAETFTHDDPSIFLRHDMNWIFTDNYIKDKKISRYIEAHRADNESDEDNPFVGKASDATDPYHEFVSKSEMKMEAIVENNDLIKYTDFTATAQLIQDWATFKAQHFNQLTELLLDPILELDAPHNQQQDDDDGHTDDVKADADDEEDDDEFDEEYQGNKKAAQFLLEVMKQSRYIMALKMQTSALKASHNVSYLNMSKIYKAFTCDHEDKADHLEFLAKHRIVKQIVDKIFEEVLKDSAFTAYQFVKENAEISQKVHEFIALCCQLMTSVLHHEWDVYPDLNRLADCKCLMAPFDDRVHVKDKVLSMEESQTKIDYLAYPAIISKAEAERFDELYEKNAMDKDKIHKVLLYPMTVCLNDGA